MNNFKIRAYTSDPYDGLYGYALIFIKLFKFINTNFEADTRVILNTGRSCEAVGEDKSCFCTIHINPRASYVKKGLKMFIFFAKNYYLDKGKNTITIVNCELPELLVGAIASFFDKNVYCFIQDLRVRNDTVRVRLINAFRVALMRKIGKAFFVNKYTMGSIKLKRKVLIGNPVFLE